jgi:hypothetical protein
MIFFKAIFLCFRRKFQLLCERMAALDQDSEMLVYRINQVRECYRIEIRVVMTLLCFFARLVKRIVMDPGRIRNFWPVGSRTRFDLSDIKKISFGEK